MTRVLFVTAVRAYPAYGGERIHVAQVISDLAELCELSVLAPALPAGAEFRPAVRAWYDLTPLPRGFAGHLAATRFVLRPDPNWLVLLQRAIAESRAELVWFNYGHWGHYVAAARAAGALTLMQTHNAQAVLTRQGLFQPPYNRWQIVTALRSVLEARHEARLFGGFDLILSVSADDQAHHAQFVGSERSLLMPNYINEAAYNVRSERDAQLVVMTANFHAFQNQRGAEWLIRDVWPLVQREVPSARLQFAGVAPPQWRRRMQGHAEVLGDVAQMADVLAGAAAAVVPLLHGSGTRFKILEALATRTPLITTGLGSAGIALDHGQHALIADDAAAFAAAVSATLNHPVEAAQRADAGYRLLQKHFGRAVNRDRLTMILHRCTKPELRT